MGPAGVGTKVSTQTGLLKNSDIEKLKEKQIKKNFTLELRNRLKVLDELERLGRTETEESECKVETIWENFLFILVIDWILRNTTANHRRGLRWKFNTFLEDLDFADDIVLLSSRYSDLENKSNLFNTYANSVGLNINKKKTQTMRINAKSHKNLEIDRNEIGDVKEFTYLGSVLDTNGGAEADIRNRILKAKTAFYGLNKIWKSSNIQSKTKIKVYKTIVRAILLYGTEAWCLRKSDIQKLEVFQNNCLRKIFKIFWPIKIKKVKHY